MKADILREKFLNFFKSKKHKIVDSDSLAPADDPTVLFTPAGMNQFKKEFLGFDCGFKRATTSQRCLRTDDLDKVGKTSVHHTFFEMLGNFSFGDYFKEDAIAWAWEFLTKELKISPDKLWVSVYQDDDEAYNIWKDKIKVPEHKIIKLGDKDNFWPAEAKLKGPNGPCGPCSEIFFDFGEDVGCKTKHCDPTCSCGRFAEIWNLVFTQFNRKEDGSLEPLPNKNIDTGMGLERLAAVMQGKTNNFETDLFQPIIKEIQSQVASRKSQEKEMLYAIADHIRAITFSIYDGVLPSNEGRGYVVRKLIRRSALHLMSMGYKKPFLYQLVLVLANVMKNPYPDLSSRAPAIAEVILAEENNFINTLETSENLLKEKFSGSPDAGEVGRIAFQLYDTHGIPLELTESWLKKHNLKISKEAFDKELEAQKNRSKLQSAMKGDVFALKELDLGIKDTKFLGYKDFSAKAKIVTILRKTEEVKKAIQGEEVVVILDQTSFYAESGGQVGDIGFITKGKNVFEVLDTKNNGKVILHVGRVKAGSFKKGDLVGAQVDVERRLAIARNHTATHLLQAALRKVLGAHVKQQGSLVSADRLRFDFTHFKEISKEDLARIEELVNGFVLMNQKLDTKELTLAAAKKNGALAFFGDKYGNKVRMVTIEDTSKELCGGTHLQATGQIGLFKIIQEGSIAAGTRRIEAVTGIVAYRIIKNEEDLLDEASQILNTSVDSVPVELQKRLSRIKDLEKQLSAQKMDAAKSSIDAMISGAETIKDMKVITAVLEGADMDLLRKTTDIIKQKVSGAVIALGSKNQDKALLILAATLDLCDKGVDVSRMIREVAAVIGGGGGGRKDFAQGSGSNPENFDAAFNKLKGILSQ